MLSAKPICLKPNIIIPREFYMHIAAGLDMWHLSSIMPTLLVSDIQGPCLNLKTVFPCMGIPMLKIRWSRDRFIFNMGSLYR